jgi:predicted ATPase
MHAALPSTSQRPGGTWHVELLGQVRAVRGDLVVTQFGSRKVTALLARLALAPQRAHAREELIDLLWPDADLDTGRNRLRQALATLRRLIEPPGAGDVLLADRQHVRLQAGSMSCDALQFETLAAQHDWRGALALYGGELMPGCYDEWVLDERQRLATLAETVGERAAEQGEPPATATPHAEPTRKRAVSTPRRAAAQLTSQQSWRPDRWMQLPAFASRFFGRETERAALHEALLTQRLITLQGPGGAGKTRLAVEAARQLAPQFEVLAFVPLADCSVADDLPNRVAAQLPLGGAGADAAALQQFLSARRALLVLDNFEQLVEPGGAAHLAAWLQTLPGLHLIVTSRRRLDLDGEVVLPVEPLPLPAPGASLADCSTVAAVAMFVDRAHSARPGFALHARNCADILALCHALEGLPLALELAASRAHAISVPDMCVQLRRSVLDLERRGARAAREPRHASLQGTLNWSWQLLTPTARQALAWLCVFRGGWTVEAAAQVWQRDDAAAQLEDLVGDALVVAVADEQGRMRYRLYDMVRSFAAERLPAADAAQARARHRAWCLASLGAAGDDWPAEEAENLQAAMQTALADGDAAMALSLAVAAQAHWERRGATPQVLDVWQQALDACDNDLASHTDPVLRLDARRLLGRRCFDGGEGGTRALALAEAAVAQGRVLAAAGGDTAVAPLCRALFSWLSIRWSSNSSSDGAWPPMHEALQLAECGTDRSMHAALLNLAGEVHLIGDRDAVAARRCYDDALALYRRLGRPREALNVELGLGICAQYERRFEVARAIHLGVAEGAAALGDRLLEIDAQNNLCVVATQSRDWATALRHGRQQFTLAARWHARYMQSLAAWNLCKPLARARAPEAAAQLMAFAAVDWELHYGTLRDRDRRYIDKVRRLVRWQIGAARTAELWARGQRLTMERAMQLVDDSALPA